MEEYPVFTLEEANYAVQSVIEVTEETLAALKEARDRWSELGLPGIKKFYPLERVTEEDYLRLQWAHKIASMGIIPKGYFVVDFQSPDPEVLYCWAYGEDEVSHEHKVWETFTDRRPLRIDLPRERERE